MLNYQIIALIVAIISLAIIINLLRRKRLQEKYSILWIIIDIFIVFLSFMPDILMKIMNLIGFYSPVNFIFSLFVFLLLGISLQLCRELSIESKKIDDLIQEIALSNQKIDELESKINNQ